ncbi:hypothetical protein SteCoe_21162 [Stentor coeruleus]|uniref:DOMON domain-containing protein n=1 Tax=Stentor coeruleus TaxID=5963 RepID=A0A1R2BQF5_9CILI|nr:hypothetical protein SteCoe_21162 [Stentor coeruleus]
MIFFLIVYLVAAQTPCFSTTFRTGMKFEYNNGEGKLHLTLHVPKTIFLPYDWAGIGIKKIEDGLGMDKADIVSIVFKKFVLDDRWARENGYPLSDEDLGGTFDTEKGPVKALLDTETKVFSWKRPLDTKDDLDIKFEYGVKYYLLWAYGLLEGDDIGYHEDRDIEVFEMIDCSKI